MTETTQNVSCETMISLDDDYFFNCIMELEDLIEKGWISRNIENDTELNTSLITLERPAKTC